MRRALLAVTIAASMTAWGQRAISAHSGMVNYVEGTVLMDGKSVDPKVTELPEVKNKSVLTTEDGRAEVLLTPGAFLRLAENSSFRMISNQLWDTRVEVVSGSAMLEIEELLKDNTVTVQYGDAQIALAKKGLYRVDAGDPGSLRVYDGESRVTQNGDGVTARKGRQVDLGAVLTASNFDSKDTDAFYNWSARRAEYIATANISSARSAGGSGYTSGGAGYGSGYAGAGYPGAGGGMWAYNPWYGMYTFLPGMGFGYSPFGYPIYSPVTVAYLPPTAYGGGGIGSLGTATARLTNPTAPPMGPRAVASSGLGAGNGASDLAPRRGGGGMAASSVGGVSGGSMGARGGSRGTR
jgi:FecR protein